MGQNKKWMKEKLFSLALSVFLFCLVNSVVPEVVYRVDPLAMLASTLRTYQRAGCDSDTLSLTCPRGTSISIELAQYGGTEELTDHSLCSSGLKDDTKISGAGDVSIHRQTEIEIKSPDKCSRSGLQYALLQIVVDSCQKKRHCKFAVNSSLYPNGDPCANIRKFVEIAYKCRPYEFRSKIACENDTMVLVCNPYSRIAIYSASFSSSEGEIIQCAHGRISVSNRDFKKLSCLISYATERVMTVCHGKRRCSISADIDTFGKPCKIDVNPYLKVLYTCIPGKILKNRYESSHELDEPQQNENQEMLYNEEFFKESNAIPSEPTLHDAIPNSGFLNIKSTHEVHISTTVPPMQLQNGSSFGIRQSQFVFYVIIIVLAFIILCFVIIIARVTILKICVRHKEHSSNPVQLGRNFFNAMHDSADCFQKKGVVDEQQTVSGERQIFNSNDKDISDNEGDINKKGPIAINNLLPQNQEYMSYKPNSSCSQVTLPSMITKSPQTTTSVLLSSLVHPEERLLTGSINSNLPSNAKVTSVCDIKKNYNGDSRQLTETSPAIFTSPVIYAPAVSETIIGNQLGLNMFSDSPSYLSGTMIVPGHYQTQMDTLRRNLIQSQRMAGAGLMPLQSVVGLPSTASIYYDSTIPRHLNSERTTDNIQYFYG